MHELNWTQLLHEEKLPWGKPFEVANYSLYTPANLQITDFSYEPDSLNTNKSGTIYYWHKTDFMPTKDMIFKFNVIH